MTLSLRTRVLLGAILWTIGLVVLSFVIIAAVFHFAPDLPVLGKRGSIHFIWSSHAFLLVVTAVIAMAGGAFQVRRGLAGIAQLRERLAAAYQRFQSAQAQVEQMERELEELLNSWRDTPGLGSISPRSIILDLSLVPRGRYEVKVQVEPSGRSAVASTRIIEIR